MNLDLTLGIKILLRCPLVFSKTRVEIINITSTEFNYFYWGYNSLERAGVYFLPSQWTEHFEGLTFSV
jgi:hypothetical protein